MLKMYKAVWSDKVKKPGKDEIIRQYEESGKLMYDATLSGDYKINNRENAKLTKLFKLFEQDTKLAEECITELLKSSNLVIRTKAAAYCLALRDRIDTAEAVLEEISNNPENGIFGFNAEMTLKVWKERGLLTIYQREDT